MEKGTVCSITKSSFVKVKPNVFSLHATISANSSEKDASIKKLNKLKGEFDKAFSKFKPSVSDFQETFNTYDYGYSNDDKFLSQCRVSFSCENIDLAKEMFDAFIKLKSVELSAPRYGVKNVGHYEQELLEASFKKCVEQAKMECAVLGVSFDDLKVVSWNNYFKFSEDTEVSASPMRAASRALESTGGGNTDNLRYDPLNINVSLQLTVNFGLK